MKVRDVYCYFFYKIYNFFKLLRLGEPQNIKNAIICTMSVESWILVSLNGYYYVLLHRNGQLKSLSIEVLYLLICLFIIQWFYFWRDNKWERYIKEFDLWPPQKNQIGGYIVTCVVIILFVNLCVALYLDSSFNPAK